MACDSWSVRLSQTLRREKTYALRKPTLRQSKREVTQSQLGTVFFPDDALRRLKKTEKPHKLQQLHKLY
jgi:hypothetical protein